MLRPIEKTLAQWSNPDIDPGERWKQLSDLSEAVRRHGDFGCHPPYSFHDPAIKAGATRLTAEQRRQIAAGAARVLLDAGEDEAMRTSAAFLLGKTRQKMGLAAVARLVCDQPDLPIDLVRQCAFTFDSLGATCDFRAMAIDLDRVGDHFERYGIPWDRASGRVDVSSL